MPALILVTHAPLASALKAVAAHAYAECAALIEAVDVQPGESAEQVQARLRAHLATLGGADALILADAFGATPCNAAMKVADGRQVRVVTGVNVPMLWRVLCYRNEPLDALAALAVGGATQGVMSIAPARPQNQIPSLTSPDDQVPHHHQQ